MNFFSMNSIIVLGSILGIGVVIAPIVRNRWLMRILIASYISLSLVFLMPDNFIFNAYANIIYFFVIVTVFTLIEGSRFFDVASWSVGRLSLESVAFSVLTVFFIASIICLFLPLTSLGIVMTKEVYSFLGGYIFYIAIAPLVFSLLFSGKLRA